MIVRRLIPAGLVLLATQLFAFAFPVQGQTAPAQHPFENEILRYEDADRKHFPEPGGIVFVGSSSIARWTTLKQDFPDFNVLNRGFGGSQVSDSVYYADRIVTPYKPNMVVFFAGTNDIAGGKTADVVFEDFRAFVKRVQEKLPKAKIAYISISPAPSRWNKIDEIKKANWLIREYCQSTKNLQFVDIYPLMLSVTGEARPELFVEDRLHMNPDGYAIWVKAITPILPKNLEARRVRH